MRRWLIVAATGLAVLPASAQGPTFTARRETVRVDVLVTDGARPVRDLRAEDFELLDSGVAQQIEFVRFEELPLSVVLALDASVSVTGEGLRDLRFAGRAAIGRLEPDDEAALITFTDSITLRERLTANFAQLGQAIDAVQPSTQTAGGTALIDACYTAITLLDGNSGRGVLIAFTDGVDTASWLSAARVLDTARRANVVVYAVSTAPVPERSFLRELASATGGGVMEIARTADLEAAFARILDEFRQRYLLAYSPVNVPAAGWHPLAVRVKDRRVAVRARPGYLR